MHILHLIDGTVGWEQRIALNQLLDQLSRGRFDQSIASVSGSARHQLGLADERVPLFARRGWMHHICGPRLRRWVQRTHVDLVHAWGLDAAETAGLALRSSTPLLVSQFDPCPPDRRVNMLRTILPMTRGAIACAASTVRRRLIERGVGEDRCVVVRPGVDFGTINETRKLRAHATNGGEPRPTLVVTADAGSPDAGQEIAVWATAARSNLDPHIQAMVPGMTRQHHRLMRAATAVGRPEAVAWSSPEAPFEALVTEADILLLPVSRDISTTAIAWAMAGSTLVVAGAVYATAELLAHQHNALLIKPDTPRRMAIRVAATLGDLEGVAELKDTARGQAYEVFGVRRCIDQHARLYDNLIAGRDPGDGIVDSSSIGVAAPNRPLNG
ncbi:MAG: glycosyltransferase family 4 protein [Planctomycetes bacterium]|nr:glycosyltransferase family 4 protein [Planctomycetota bacterium]